MSSVKFTCDVSGILFPDIKILYNEVALDSTDCPLMILFARLFLKLSQIHIFF